MNFQIVNVDLCVLLRSDSTSTRYRSEEEVGKLINIKHYTKRYV